MKIAVTGSTGLIGSALVPYLTAGGDRVSSMVRPGSKGAEANGILWEPSTGIVDSSALEGFDAVVHLAGESIASGRWTAERKRRILESRTRGTSLLAETLSLLSTPPRVLVCASAIGYYGDRGAEVLREDSRPGSSFLAQVCQEWESAARPAGETGIRVVNLRFGLILSRAGGALATMLPPFRLGLGGKIGSGRQYMSWIALDDVLGVIQHAIQTDEMLGPVNTVAPQSVTNLEFTKTLGRVLSRPTIFPLPGFVARIMFGEMADELLLASTRVEPARLIASGYRFRFPELENALSHLLGSRERPRNP